MPLLNDDLKAEIVTLLAQFRGASEVARLIEVEHGVQVDRFQIRTYDPSKPAFAAGDRWRLLFEEVRADYLHQVSAVPIAHKAYRLNELQRNYDRARQTGNLVLANATLEQAAKEVGGALTNQHQVTTTSTYRDMSPDDRRAAFVRLIDRALANKPLPAAVAA
jgi:hypothetical protein